MSKENLVFARNSETQIWKKYDVQLSKEISSSYAVRKRSFEKNRIYNCWKKSCLKEILSSYETKKLKLIEKKNKLSLYELWKMLNANKKKWLSEVSCSFSSIMLFKNINLFHYIKFHNNLKRLQYFVQNEVIFSCVYNFFDFIIFTITCFEHCVKMQILFRCHTHFVQLNSVDVDVNANIIHYLYDERMLINQKICRTYLI